jgi:hypothetical protein
MKSRGNIIRIALLAIVVTTAGSAHANDDRKARKNCAQNGVPQTATWAWTIEAGIAKIVEVGTQGSLSASATANCEQTSMQLDPSAKGTYKAKEADGRGSDACAKAVVHPPSNTPDVCKDITFPCGSSAAEQAPKPQE